jgi:hypothetical protein
MLSVNGQKRLTAKEHSDRVRFDATTVKQKLPRNGFRLVFPRDELADDAAMYERIQKKTGDNWKKATGTVTQIRPVPFEDDKKKKKPLKKKKSMRRKKVVKEKEEG